MSAEYGMNEKISKITESLRKISPYKIILFGSYLGDRQREDSDVDLLVILDSEDVPKTYEEKMENRLFVRRSVYDCNREIPIDLFVYTKGEYDIVSSQQGSFLSKIEKVGRVLYEKRD